MISQIIAKVPPNIGSILNNFKSFIQKVYQKESTQNIKKKKDQNNYFREEINQKEQQLLRLKVKKKTFFNNTENLLFFLNSNFYKSKFAKTYMSYKKLAIVSHINIFNSF